MDESSFFSNDGTELIYHNSISPVVKNTNGYPNSDNFNSMYYKVLYSLIPVLRGH